MTTDLTDTRAAEDARGRLRDPARFGEDFLRALYGPAWSDALHHYEDAGRDRVRFRRLPKPRKVADFLRPFLVDRLSHDGRGASGRDRRRNGGWWLRDETSGSWRSVAVVEVVDTLAEFAEALLGEALTSVEVAEKAVEVEEYAAGTNAKRRTPGGAPEETYKVRSRAREVAAASGSLSGLLENGLASVGAVLEFYKEREDFRLPDEVLAGQIREWLAEDVVDVVPGLVPGARVRAADLWRMYEAGPVAGLTKGRTFALLDGLLGPRDYRDPTRPVYTLPALDDFEEVAS